jgi:hypothetical protein
MKNLKIQEEALKDLEKDNQELNSPWRLSDKKKQEEN